MYLRREYIEYLRAWHYVPARAPLMKGRARGCTARNRVRKTTQSTPQGDCTRTVQGPHRRCPLSGAVSPGLCSLAAGGGQADGQCTPARCCAYMSWAQRRSFGMGRPPGASALSGATGREALHSHSAGHLSPQSAGLRRM